MAFSSTSSYKSAGIFLRVTSGATSPVSSRYWGFLGYTTDNTEAAYRCPPWSGIIIPTETTVKIKFYDLESDEVCYVYRT